MAIKLTLSLDEQTVALLEQAAERLRRPKSQVVREAIRDYAARADRLSETERLRLLSILDEALERIPQRPASEVDEELASVRAARRTGGRASGGRAPGGRGSGGRGSGRLGAAGRRSGGGGTTPE